MAHTLEQLNQQITACRQCPRLVTYLDQVGIQKRAAYRDDAYWSKPVPNLIAANPASASLLVVGLAPGAHGANRTGRMFTGDRSGDFLFRAMHQAGLASQPESTDLNDGLILHHCVITAAGHCAPPGNKPTREELANCRPFLSHTIDAMPNLRAVVTLGKIAHDAFLQEAIDRTWLERKRDAPFKHAAIHALDNNGPVVLASYHPSQQNTFTGRLTHDMLLAVFVNARRHALENL
ncbi:uracil-DNA glycosylase [Mucisphaera sp.]|uniref:uracil-DNA glycosylase n=1 Tax=Mucisphaera sp. TaxID=2913024 RepID=UPI003D0A0CFF